MGVNVAVLKIYGIFIIEQEKGSRTYIALHDITFCFSVSFFRLFFSDFILRCFIGMGHGASLAPFHVDVTIKP